MAGITLTQAETQLANALAALERACEAQRYVIASPDGSREAEQADIDKLQKLVEFWNRQVQILSRSSTNGSVRLAFPDRSQ